MKLLKVVTTYKTDKDTAVGRQTNHFTLSQLEEGKQELVLRGDKVEKITLEIIESKDVEARIAQLDRAQVEK